MELIVKTNVLKEALENKGVFREHSNEIITSIVDTIKTRLQPNMKLQLAVHQLIFYMSQFRPSIAYIGQSIPINSIAFLFSQSGTGKDTSINNLKRIFNSSFAMIEDKRMELNHARAHRLLKQSKNEKATLESFLIKLPELNVGVSTDEGLISSIDEAQKISLGSLNVNTNEFIADMTNKSNLLLPLLTTLAETYDLGNKQSKNLKDKTKEVKSLVNVSLNALFTSSFNLFDNTKVRYSIMSEFKSRFARRASITFNITKPSYITTDNLSDWLKEKKQNNRFYLDSTQTLSDKFDEITSNLLNSMPILLILDDEAEDIYLLYQQYCLQVGNSLNSLEHSLMSLNTTNRYFQSLKLSGALSMLNNNNIGVITKENIIDAINIIEEINKDIEIFENELTKLDYEVLIDHCKELYSQQKSKISIPLYILTKYGFVQNSSNIDELLKQCNSKEKEGMFITDKNKSCIMYEYLEMVDKFNITYKSMEGISKEDRGTNLGGIWKTTQVPFEALVRLLNKDFAYSGFIFKDNIRNKDNLIPKTNLLVFDIDKSNISYSQLHDILKDNLNHIVATTKDKDNPYKFRVLIPLTSTFTIEPQFWKAVLKEVAKDYILDIDTDQLPQSQIFYSYKDSNILYTNDKHNLDLKKYLIQVISANYNKKLSPKEKQSQLTNPRATFGYAYNMKEGSRNITFIRMINHAFDLGMSYDDLEELINDVNSYIDQSLTQEELNKHIYPHLRKKYGL